MYTFKITDEPFARGYLECPESSIHLRTGHAFIRAAKEMELSLFEEIGLPDASFKNMAATYHFSTGESVNEELIKEHAAFKNDVRRMGIKFYNEWITSEDFLLWLI